MESSYEIVLNTENKMLFCLKMIWILMLKIIMMMI